MKNLIKIYIFKNAADMLLILQD